MVRNRLEEAAGRDELPLNWHQIDVRTFDSFATYLLAWLQENSPSILPAGYSLEGQSYDARIHMAAHILSAQKDLLAEYQHIIRPASLIEKMLGSQLSLSKSSR